MTPMNQYNESECTPDLNSKTETNRHSTHSIRVQMLGGSGVGKTCFMAGLALLNEQSDGRTFVLPTDDTTKAVFDSLRMTLSSGSWPQKTSIARALSFAITRHQKRIDIQLSDFAGESFSDSMLREVVPKYWTTGGQN